MQALRRVGGGERRNQGAADSQGVGAERVSSVSGHHDWIYLAVPSVQWVVGPPRAVTLRTTAGLPGNTGSLARSLAGPMGQ